MGYVAKMVKKPTGAAAWSVSVAAGLDLCAFVLMAASNPGTGSLLLLLLFGGCVLVLILAAIAEWKRYFEGLIDYRIGELEGRED